MNRRTRLSPLFFCCRYPGETCSRDKIEGRVLFHSIGPRSGVSATALLCEGRVPGWTPAERYKSTHHNNTKEDRMSHVGMTHDFSGKRLHRWVPGFFAFSGLKSRTKVGGRPRAWLVCRTGHRLAIKSHGGARFGDFVPKTTAKVESFGVCPPAPRGCHASCTTKTRNENADLDMPSRTSILLKAGHDAASLLLLYTSKGMPTSPQVKS